LGGKGTWVIKRGGRGEKKKKIGQGLNSNLQHAPVGVEVDIGKKCGTRKPKKKKMEKKGTGFEPKKAPGTTRDNKDQG